ncbi:hypothetical protein I7I48_10337 [Histoplasma ohiense]|nr:hypothetical protein I7I48_10337 [Histoplasma ohiense (nom. inval.)]
MCSTSRLHTYRLGASIHPSIQTYVLPAWDDLADRYLRACTRHRVPRTAIGNKRGKKQSSQSLLRPFMTCSSSSSSSSSNRGGGLM